jgi:hypothetical protein
VQVAMMGVELFVGGQPGTIQGERIDLGGRCMFTAVHHPVYGEFSSVTDIEGIVDSGAFSDPPTDRLTHEQALGRQLQWESRASEMWQGDWVAYGLVSYDLLIDETWLPNGKKIKRRWSVKQAETAVTETVAAAAYLSSQRERLQPRKLILSAQGVDAIQYHECTQGVLQYARPEDWFGFGGWCILGRQQTLLPEFWKTLHLVMPEVKKAGIANIHLFGVLWEPALAGMLYLSDEYGLTLSTDSTAPLLACTRKNHKKAGVRAKSGYWRDNVAWWKNRLANLRQSPHYKRPPNDPAFRQARLL